MNSENNQVSLDNKFLLPILYIFGRLVLFLGSMPNFYYGTGDLQRYRETASLAGWPYFHHWIEYPPIFPFISEIAYRVSSGNRLFYDTLIISLLTVCGAVTIYLFHVLAEYLDNHQTAKSKTLVFFCLMIVLPYTWWYMDIVIVALMLAAIYYIINKRVASTAITLSIGILAKWFPLLLIPALFKYLNTKKALQIAVFTVLIVMIVFGILYWLTPEFTTASLLSQPGRNSWQTVWAILDGNFTTGEYILLPERYNPDLVALLRGNPPTIPPSLTLFLFAGMGIFLFFRKLIPGSRYLFLFIGITWILYLLWMPGWSPQWILYLLPLILLLFKAEKGLFISSLLILVTIMEWPLLMNYSPVVGTIFAAPLRTVLLAFLGVTWSVDLLKLK